MYPDLIKTIESIQPDSVAAERKDVLQQLIDYIRFKRDVDGDIRLSFICTHNSRRSHLAQVWAQAAAMYYDIKNVTCYSGGTEATAMYPMIAKTLMKAGFKVKAISGGANPVYTVKFAENELPVIAFSKIYDDDFNPETGFAVIMTCSQADEGCPFISGAEKRVVVPFDDPKEFDGTSRQAEKYEESGRRIATEMFYVFSQIKK